MASVPAPQEPPEEPTDEPPEPPKKAWVVYHRTSGHVAAVYFREPHSTAFDPWKYRVVESEVGPEIVAHVHDLRSVGGPPRRGMGLAGI
jgi:hypothetical protein